MESAYGIGIANRYAAFIDNEDDASSIDPYALLTNAADADSSKLASGVKTGGPATAAAPGGKPGGAKGPTGGGPGGKPGQQRQQQQQQHGSFGDAGALSESKANVAANQKDAGRQQKGSRTGGNPNQRPVRGDQENRTQRSPRVNNASFGSPTFGEGQDGELKPSGGRDFRDGGKDRRNGFEGGRGGGGRRGGPGGAGGPGGPRGGARFGGGKRDFNRHSGSDKTGIKATEKRDGAGAHNWGKPLDDFGAAPEDELAMNGGSAEQTGAEPTGAEGSGGEAGTGAEGEENKLGEDGEPKVDEPVVKTLDEYKREREEKRLHTQFNTRKANEGEDKSKWKKTYVLKKKEKTDEEEVEYEEIEVEEDPNKRRGRQVLDIEINFRPSDEGRDFTRRGGPGGRGGRGGPRTPRPDGGERRGGGGGEGGERGPPGEDRRRGPPRGEGGSGGPGGAEGGGRPPRGGAGGGRPDRGSGRGGGRGGQGGGRFQAAPKFDDLNDFPSL